MYVNCNSTRRSKFELHESSFVFYPLSCTPPSYHGRIASLKLVPLHPHSFIRFPHRRSAATGSKDRFPHSLNSRLHLNKNPPPPLSPRNYQNTEISRFDLGCFSPLGSRIVCICLRSRFKYDPGQIELQEYGII